MLIAHSVIFCPCFPTQQNITRIRHLYEIGILKEPKIDFATWITILLLSDKMKRCKDHFPWYVIMIPIKESEHSVNETVNVRRHVQETFGGFVAWWLSLNLEKN